DIETEVGRLADVYLYTVDDLGRIVQTASDARQAAVVQAEAIIDTRVKHFMDWLESRANVPVIQQYQQAADAVQQHELEKARRALARGEDPNDVLEQLAYGLTQKHLHGPLSALPGSRDAEREHLLSLLPRFMPTVSRRRSSYLLLHFMYSSMRERLDQLAHRLTDIDALLSQPEMAEDLDGFRKLSLERAEVEPVVLAYNAYRQAEETMADAKILMDDAEMRDLAQEEYETAQAEHQ